MVDARAGMTPEDRFFANLLRRSGKPLILIANKAEGRPANRARAKPSILALASLCRSRPSMAKGLAIFMRPCASLAGGDRAEPGRRPKGKAGASAEDEDGSELDPTKPLRIAVIGRPNAGKSTLLNRILGEERLLTGPEAGITRDAIGVDLDWQGRKLKIFDTAGLRKRARVDEKLEKLAGADALRAAKFAEVVVLLIDATVPFEKQDLTLADLVAREGRALVIALNKWDLVEGRGAKLRALREEAAQFAAADKGHAGCACLGRDGRRYRRADEADLQSAWTWNKRIATSKLNRWLTHAIQERPRPPSPGDASKFAISRNCARGRPIS